MKEKRSTSTKSSNQVSAVINRNRLLNLTHYNLNTLINCLQNWMFVPIKRKKITYQGILIFIHNNYPIPSNLTLIIRSSKEKWSIEKLGHWIHIKYSTITWMQLYRKTSSYSIKIFTNSLKFFSSGLHLINCNIHALH